MAISVCCSENRVKLIQRLKTGNRIVSKSELLAFQHWELRATLWFHERSLAWLRSFGQVLKPLACALALRELRAGIKPLACASGL